ncbi:hypothetical protein [Vibrio sonorensis]|uniref:hypothetical protein n=1 Tax=Vibrio sonorensis TaxID=1004316 RepID=UPI0008DAF8E8|nr:hypothetical protein [Vibrio sonorensis]
MTKQFLDYLIRCNIALQYYLALRRCNNVADELKRARHLLPMRLAHDLNLHDVDYAANQCQQKAQFEKRRNLKLLIQVRQSYCFACDRN